MKSYWVYIVLCSDESYYTGCTSELQKRINEHNTGFFKGYTLTRRPVRLVFSQEFNQVEEAIRAERQIKKWSRKKLLLIIISSY